jgi:hypothetical protein
MLANFAFGCAIDWWIDPWENAHVHALMSLHGILQAPASGTRLEWTVCGRAGLLLSLSWALGHHWSYFRRPAALQWQQKHRRCGEWILTHPPRGPSFPHNVCSSNVVFIRIDDLIIPDNACHDVDRSIIWSFLLWDWLSVVLLLWKW